MNGDGDEFTRQGDDGRGVPLHPRGDRRHGSFVSRVQGVLPVAAHHLEGELRDALYVGTRGAVDQTKPRRFYGFLNERCNLRCRGCHYWRMDQYAQEMSADRWIRTLADIKDFVGRYHISFSGGEPLLKDGLFEILNYCRDNAILAGLTTNGAILRDRQAAELVEAQLLSINVSLDGATDATHDFLRGSRGSFKGVIRTIDLMQKHAELAAIPVPIVIKPTVSRLNYREMPELVKLVTELGVKGVLFQPMSDWGTPETAALTDIDDYGEMQTIVNRLIDMKREGFPILSPDWHIRDWLRHFKGLPRQTKGGVECWVGITTLVIKADGELHNCHTLDPIGNVRDGSVRDIWYSDRARERRAESSRCTLACSENCNVKRTLREEASGAVRLLRV